MHHGNTLGIVFALEMETRGLRRVLAHSKLLRTRDPRQSAWQVGSVRVVVEVSGMGRGRCAESVHRLIDHGTKWIVCAGYAAALDEKARVGDVVVADCVGLCGSAGDRIQCSRSLRSAVPPSGTLGYTVWRSDMVTSDSMVLRASDKQGIYHRTGAAALDMEAYAAAEACDIRGVPFLVVKGVSDTADQDLPDEVEALAGPASLANRLGIIVSRPGLWPQLWRLRNNSLKAGDNLGDVIGTMLLRLFG